MAPIPVQKVDISQTPSQPPQNQESGSGSAGSAPSPQDRAPLGANYYLNGWLEGVEAQHYRGTQSFMTAIKSQADQLSSGNGGQYAVFSQVTQDDFANIERFNNTHCKSLRFLYYAKEEILIVKITGGPAQEVTCGRFQMMMAFKLVEMGLDDELCDMRSTKYQGIDCGKEPDCAFQPRSPRPDITDWPTLVIECRVSQSLPDLRRDAHWWFENSRGKVQTVLLFSINRTKRKIHIQQWEMGEEEEANLRVTCLDPDSTGTSPKCIRTIDIVTADAAGAFLQLSFEKLFLRKPSKGETDIVFSTEDLEKLGAYVWRSPGGHPPRGASRPPGGASRPPGGASRPPGEAPTGLTSRASGAWSRASVLSERLPLQRMTVGSYSPLPTSHSPTVPSVFARHLHSPIAWKARPLPLGPANCLKVTTHPPRPVIRSHAKIPVPPGRPFRYWALGNTAYLGWRLLAAQL